MKKIMLMLFVFVIVIGLPIISFAYEGSPEEQVSAFFKDISAGKGNEAIDSLYKSNPAFGEKLQQLTMLKQQLSAVNALYGKSIAQENYVVEKPTPSVTRIVIVDKHEKHPIIWEFYFYKPLDKWMVSQGIFNDQFGLLNAKQ